MIITKIFRFFVPKKTMSGLVANMTKEARKISEKQAKSAALCAEMITKIKAAEEACLAEKAAADQFIAGFEALVAPKEEAAE